MSPANDKNQKKVDFRALFANEIEGLMQRINAVDAKILRSQMEVDKLSKKNTLANSNLEKIQTIIDRASKDQIVQVYQNALDVNQRFLTMRSQVDKLAHEKVVLESEVVLLEKLRSAFDNLLLDLESVSANSSSTLETIIQSQESERLNLAKQMHDGPAQQLSNFILQTEIANRFLSIDPKQAEGELQSLKDSATKTFEDVRNFIFKLRPMMLDDLGLLPTLKRFVGILNDKYDETISLNFTGSDRRFKSYLEILVFRSVQELLDNALAHSGASEIKVNLDLSEMRIKVQVEDDGNGFDYTSVSQETKGVGLAVLQDRIRLLNGEIEINSNIGNGTSITFFLPTDSL